jgi:hypothetical protein
MVVYRRPDIVTRRYGANRASDPPDNGHYVINIAFEVKRIDRGGSLRPDKSPLLLVARGTFSPTNC